MAIRQLHQDPGAPLVIYVSRATAARLHASARAAGAPAWRYASAILAEAMADDAAAHGAKVSVAATPLRAAFGVPAQPALLHLPVRA